MDKDDIIDAVRSYECPMLDELDLKKTSKPELIKHLMEACCPALEKLANIK